MLLSTGLRLPRAIRTPQSLSDTFSTTIYVFSLSQSNCLPGVIAMSNLQSSRANTSLISANAKDLPRGSTYYKASDYSRFKSKND